MITSGNGFIAKSRRTLVAGGAGFIGSHLCALLLDQGHRVTCLDNLVTGEVQNIEHLRSAAGFDFVEGDVRKPIAAAGQFDEIYNLACPASPIAYQADPIGTITTSIVGAINLLELARTQGARILHASTSEVYGDPVSHPQKETDWGNVNPIGPRACYDEGKRCAETLFFDYYRAYDVPVRVARIFNTYGPRMSVSDGRVVSNFIVQALQNRNITIYGDGLQTRSFCYIEDLIAGLNRLMAAPDKVTGPMNLGNPQECTIAELAALVIQLTGSRSRIVNKPLPVDDPRQRRPDITQAETSLHWTPKVQLQQGLERTIAYFEDLLQRKPLRSPVQSRATTVHLSSASGDSL
jgi:UDP-glucuronate decarboxylase